MKESKSLFHMDGWKSRMERLDFLNKPDNIYAKAWFGTLCVLAFCFIDLFCLKTVWNLVQTEDYIFVYCCAVACAIALDVPLAICALAVKKWQDGLYSLKERNIVAGLSLSVFLIAFLFSFAFRLYTRDLTFSTETEAGLVNTVEDGVETEQTIEAEESSDDDAVLVAALFNAVIPLLTSISSFIISYWAAEPLKAEILKHEKAKIEIENHITECDRALSQAGAPGEFASTQIARENDLYDAFVEQIDTDCNIREQAARLTLMTKLGTAEDVTEIAKSAKKLSERYPEDKTPGQRLPEELEKHMKKDALGGQEADGVPSVEESAEAEELGGRELIDESGELIEGVAEGSEEPDAAEGTPSQEAEEDTEEAPRFVSDAGDTDAPEALAPVSDGPEEPDGALPETANTPETPNINKTAA